MPKSKDAVLLTYKNVKILRYNYIDDIVYIYIRSENFGKTLEKLWENFGKTLGNSFPKFKNFGNPLNFRKTLGKLWECAINLTRSCTNL